MDGILVVAKPVGPTSHDIVALVRRLTGTKRVGHGGTLDPFAAGVLPIFLGKATRVVEYHLGATKRYRATVCFGASSTTDDLEGELTPADGPAPAREQVEAELAGFRGTIDQRPPAYSAIKVGGRRAYALARAGETPEIAPRRITIHDITLTDWDDTDPARPIATVDVECSAGTYVRAIARDLGAAVGNAAYLGALTRTRSGSFSLSDAVPIETLRRAAAEGAAAVAALLLPLDAGLEAFPTVVLNAAEREAAIRGQFVRPAAGLPRDIEPGAMLRLRDQEGALVALARIEGSRLLPDKVLVDLSPAPRSPATLPAAPVPDPVAAAYPVAAPGPVVAPDTRLLAGLDSLEVHDGPLFVVVGVFDGIHRGHAYLLGELRAEAGRHAARATVITFDAHPDEILVGNAPPLLCDPDERLVRLADAGVEITVVQHFDRALRMTPYDDFIAMISRRTRLAGLLMTPDAAFGHERRGTVDALTVLGRTQGFEVAVVPTYQVAGREVRSADIRQLISVGDLVGAAALLGRPYAFAGERSAAEQGSLADPRREILTFQLPVALPPPGVHRGYAEAAWRSGTQVSGTLPVEVVVPGEPGWLEIRADSPLPDAPRLRVTLTA